MKREPGEGTQGWAVSIYLPWGQYSNYGGGGGAGLLKASWVLPHLPNLARQMVDADAIEADYKQE